MAAVRPRILAVLPGFIPSTMITVVKPLLGLHRQGLITARIVLESQAGENDIRWAEIIVLCRNTDPRHGWWLAAAISRGTPLIYDLDDNLFELPPDCDDPSRASEPPGQAMLERYLRAATLVRVYSEALVDRVVGLNPRVVQSFAPVDLSLVPPPWANRPPGPIKIVYATSRTEDTLCGIFEPGLARTMRRYGERIEVHFWGSHPPRFATAPNIHNHSLVYGYDHFLRRFSRAGYDIGLAPLPDDDFFRSKTNNKFREYGACGIAGIYSRNEVYERCVRHESTGLLVSNDADGWHQALVRLVEDDLLRQEIQQRARQYVSEHYAQEKFERLFLEQLEGVLGMRVPEASASSELSAMCGRPSAVGSLFRRLIMRSRESLEALRRVPRRRFWTALRWFVNDRCLAVWLRWQLRR